MKKLVPALSAAIMMLGMTSAAYATEWMDCSDATDHVQLGVLLGGLDFAEASRVHMKVGEEWWSTDPTVEPGSHLLSIADYFFDWKELHITVTDADANVILGEMHILVAESESDIAKGGVLSIPGKGVWAVACDGP